MWTTDHHQDAHIDVVASKTPLVGDTTGEHGCREPENRKQ